MSFLRGLGGLAKKVEAAATTVAAVAEVKISARNLLLLTEYKRITTIAEKAESIRKRLSAFDETRTKAEALLNSKKSISNDFLNISSALQLMAKMADMLSFVGSLTELSKEAVNLLPEITKIQEDCKALLDELKVIYSHLNDPKQILETAPQELYNFGKQFAKELLSGEFANNTLTHFKKVEATVNELEQKAKEMNAKTQSLQSGYSDLIGLVNGKMKTAESDKQATTFISSTPVVASVEKIAAVLPGFKP